MNRKSKTKVSIILAHYNREDIVIDTLRSIQNQTFRDFECLVIDDCSTDNSPKIIKELCEQDERFIYSKNPENGGKCSSYNRGIKIARGQYLVFVDNDDIFDQNYLAELYRAIENDKSDMAVCNYNIWYCDTGEIVTPLLHEHSASGGLRDKKDYLDKEWYLMFPPQVWTKIFRKDIIVDNNLEFINVAREGNLFIHKYQYFCNKISVIPEELVNYRLFSDINKHSSGGRYYTKSDVLYEMIKFRDERISDKKQRIAWDLYLAKFIHEVYSNRLADYGKVLNIETIKNDQREFVRIIELADIHEGVKDLSLQKWDSLVDLRDGVALAECLYGLVANGGFESTHESIAKQGIGLLTQKIKRAIRRGL